MVEHGWTRLPTAGCTLRNRFASRVDRSKRFTALDHAPLFLSVWRVFGPSGSKWNTLFLYPSSRYGRDYGFETKPSPPILRGRDKALLPNCCDIAIHSFHYPFTMVAMCARVGSANLDRDMDSLKSAPFASKRFISICTHVPYVRWVAKSVCTRHLQFYVFVFAVRNFYGCMEMRSHAVNFAYLELSNVRKYFLRATLEIFGNFVLESFGNFPNDLFLLLCI